MPASSTLTRITARALQLHSRKLSGATFDYPQALTFIEWLALEILEEQRDLGDRQRLLDRMKPPEPSAEDVRRAKLHAAMRKLPSFREPQTKAR